MNPAAQGMTFQDFIVRVATRLGVRDLTAGSNGLPKRAHDLALCKEHVNEGYRRFLAGVRPGMKPYRHWTFLRPEIVLTLSADGTGGDCIDGDSSRYRLPYNQAVRPRFWTVKESGVAGVGTNALDTSIEWVRSMLTSTTSTGRPTRCAVTPRLNGAPGVDDRGWEAVFYPRPDKDYVVSAPVRIQPRDLVELEDRHVAGAVHDEAIAAQAILAAMRRNVTDQNTGQFGIFQQDATDLLNASIEIDKANHPAVAGDMSDPTTEGDTIPYPIRRPYVVP